MTIVGYRSIGIAELEKLLRNETIYGTFEGDDQSTLQSKKVVMFFKKPIQWKNKGHVVLIKCHFTEDDVVENSVGQYYASKKVHTDGVWDGRHGNYEYYLNEFSVLKYDISNVESFINPSAVGEIIQKELPDLYDTYVKLNKSGDNLGDIHQSVKPVSQKYFFICNYLQPDDTRGWYSSYVYLTDDEYKLYADKLYGISTSQRAVDKMVAELNSKNVPFDDYKDKYNLNFTPTRSRYGVDKNLVDLAERKYIKLEAVKHYNINHLPMNVKDIKNMSQFLRDIIPLETDSYWKSMLTDVSQCSYMNILGPNETPLKRKREIVQKYLNYKNKIQESAKNASKWYHGSPNKYIKNLEIGKSNTNGDALGRGVYLTSDFDEAKQYAGDGIVYEVTLDDSISLFNMANKLTEYMVDSLYAELQNTGMDLAKYFCMFNRKVYDVLDKNTGLEFFRAKTKEWETLDGKYLGNRPQVVSDNGKLKVKYTDYEDLYGALRNITGDELLQIIASELNPDVLSGIITSAGYNGIITHNNTWAVIYNNLDNIHIVSDKTKKEEASRNELLAIAKGETITRYNKAPRV